MKQIFRNFVHVTRRFKTSSILNLLGLSAAFTIFIVVMMQVYYDFSFDRFHKDVDSVYMLNQYDSNADRFKDKPYQTMDVGVNLGTTIPEVNEYCMIDFEGLTEGRERRLYTLDQDGRKRYTDQTIAKVTSEFTDIFSINITQGDAKEALSSRQKVMISEGFAQKHFGTTDLIGKTIYLEKDSATVDANNNRVIVNNDQFLTISAIYKDFPQNSTLKNSIYTFLPYDASPWNSNYLVFFNIDTKNVSKARNSMDAILNKDRADNKLEIQLNKFSETHFNSYAPNSKADKSTILSLLAVGIVALLIAYINFVNFTVAMTPARTKTINIQKILGANTVSLRMSIAFESVISTFVAFIIALILVTILGSSFLQQLFTAEISIIANVGLVCILGVLFFIVSFLFGIYPAYHITAVDTIQALNSRGSSVRSAGLRNILVVIQFIAAIFLIITASFIKLQHDYVVNYEWGFQKENIVYVAATDFQKKNLKVETIVFANELLKSPNILDYTLTLNTPGKQMQGWGRTFEGERINLTAWSVSDNFLDFMGVPMVEGQNFTENKEINKVIFNQTLLNEYNLTDVIGKKIGTTGSDATIIGIAKDINFESLRSPIRPMAFFTDGYAGRNVFIKISGSNTKEAIKDIENTWKQFSDQGFNLHFLDEEMDQLYQADKNLGNLLTLFSIVAIAIAIAIMGVYGLITFNSKYRAREIAIRKVNGAEENEILIMLNRGVLIQLIIGFVIATLIAYYVVNRWLEQFAYKIDVYWWVFLLGGLLILIITLFTVSLQSYRAAIANPVKALKSE